MKCKIFALFLTCAIALSLYGCGKMGEIASNVMDTAMQELKNQVTKVLEENKLEVVELKTVVGKLNDDAKYQFFIAALVRSDSTAIPQSTADSLGKMFSQAGLVKQTESEFSHPALVYKTITFKHTDFSGDNYYVIYAYSKDITASMPDINATLPQFGK